MSERSKIEERLRKKEQEIASLDEKLRAARVYVQALKDILKLLGDNEEATEEPDAILRAGSAVAQAREIILQRKSPIHINDLLAAMGKDVTRESKASLTSSLAAYVRKNEIFSRPAPSTFGLLELGHTDAVEPDDGPPSEFGRDTASEQDDDIPF